MSDVEQSGGKAGRGFSGRYEDLEARMRAMAESDGDEFLPNPEPPGPVDYVFIGMEPSLGGGTPSSVKADVEMGAKNFVNSIEDFILHFCIRQYLCQGGERYYITDISKGALRTKLAGKERTERWDRWYELLVEELDLVARPDAGVFALGQETCKQLARRSFPLPLTTLIHYSGQNGLARKRCTETHEGAFQLFKESIDLEDVLATGEEVLKETSVPNRLQDETLDRLRRRQLSESRKRLIYCYKLVFERR